MADLQLRIFVSSPSDLEHERALVKDIIEALAQEYLPYFKLRAVLWEQEALTAAQSFQAGLVRPSECEIVLVMLWTRLGTPLARDPYGGMTGTEWEFVDAVEASAQSGSPEVLVYRKTAPCLVDVNNAEATREALADRYRLEDFFRAHFFNVDGSFRRAFRQFATDRALRDLVETQLRKLLNRRISNERRLSSVMGDWHGNPFRVQRPFEFSDNPIFTGREAETRELVTRLEGLSGGRGLLLLTGPSGVGKSSLIRAGLLPRLARPSLFSGIAQCRWCLVDLDNADPLLTLATALTGPAILGPALQGFGLDADRLARLLITEPAVAVDEVAAALTQLRTDLTLTDRATGGGGRTQLAVVVDPLDPLFTEPLRQAPSGQAFARALHLLASREGIWVIASLRSDYLNQVNGFPELVAALDATSWFPLQPPALARIRQVIEIPARIADIGYEDLAAGTGRGLIDILEAEASLLAHWPPILQQTLDDLYRQARARAGEAAEANPPLLTLEDYRLVGGLPGAVLARAETLWRELEPPLREALPCLCRALISLEGGGSAAPGPRAGDLRTLIGLPSVGPLLERLIAARLVVADAELDLVLPAAGLVLSTYRLPEDLRRRWLQTQDEWRARLGLKPLSSLGQGLGTEVPPLDAGPTLDLGGTAQRPRWEDYRPIASFSHPVLIDRWRPVQDWLAQPTHRQDLILRYQLSRQARLWRRTDANREYLLGESGYAATLGFAEAYSHELEPLERDYLEKSRQHLLQRRWRKRLARSLALTLFILLVVATYSAWLAGEKSELATLNFHTSQLKSAATAIDRGNTAEAIRLGLDAGSTLPVEATDTLSRAFVNNRLIALVRAGAPVGDDKPLASAFSDDGQLLVTQAAGGGADLWRLQGERYHYVQRLFDPKLKIHAVREAGGGDEAMILGIGRAGVWRLPATADQAPTWTCGGRADTPLALDPAGRYLALQQGEKRARGLCVLDLRQPGKPLWQQERVHERGVRSLAFSADGQLLVTASMDGTARVIETLTGLERVKLPATGALNRPAYHAIFDPAGERIAVAWGDDRIRLYDLSGRQLAELGIIVRDGQPVRIHRAAIRQTAFAPNGQALVAVDEDGQVVRWDLVTGHAHLFGHHDLSVEQVRISTHNDPSNHEPLVLTASLDDTVRLWGLWTGQSLGIVSHEGDVTEAHFTQDEAHFLSYSPKDASARLWSVRPTSPIAYPLPGSDQVAYLAMAQEQPTPAASEAPPTTLLATAAFDGHVEVWRYGQGQAETPVRLWSFGGEGQGHIDRVRRLHFSPSARLLASASADGTARVWDLASGQSCVLAMTDDAQPCTRNNGDQDCPTVYQALFAPHGDWLVTTSSDPRQPVRLWQVRSDPLECAPLANDLPWEVGEKGVRSATIRETEDGGIWLATGGDESGEVRVLRADETGHWSLLCKEPWHQNTINDLTLSPAGDQLATASEDGRAALIALSSAGCDKPRYLEVKDDESKAGAVTSLRYAPDGQALAFGTATGKLQVWRPDGTLMANLQGHDSRVTNVAFAPDGAWLLAAARDGSIRLWRRPTYPLSQPLAPYLTLSASFGSVSYARFSPDGSRIGAAYRNDITLLWRIWSQDPEPPPELAATWGPERARLSIIQAAQRFMTENLQPEGPKGQR